MIFRHFLSICLCAVYPVFLTLSGCTSYGPAKHPELAPPSEGSADEIVAGDSTFEIHFVPLFDKERANAYLGINPARSKIMPALVKVVNLDKQPIKVDLRGSYLVVDPNEHWNSLELGEAIRRALRNDAEVVGWMFAFGLPAWYAAAGNAANTNRTLEQDYHAKYFKPTLINAGASGQGVVFFDAPQQGEYHISAAVIRVRKVNAGPDADIRLAVGQDVRILP